MLQTECMDSPERSFYMFFWHEYQKLNLCQEISFPKTICDIKEKVFSVSKIKHLKFNLKWV